MPPKKKKKRKQVESRSEQLSEDTGNSTTRSDLASRSSDTTFHSEMLGSRQSEATSSGNMTGWAASGGDYNASARTSGWRWLTTSPIDKEQHSDVGEGDYKGASP